MGIIVIFDKYNRNVFCSGRDKMVNVFFMTFSQCFTFKLVIE